MSRPPPIPKRPPRPATPVELRDAIRDEALRLGFDAVGFAPAGLAPEARRERLQRLSEFVEAGWQGDMGWLGERTELLQPRSPGLGRQIGRRETHGVEAEPQRLVADRVAQLGRRCRPRRAFGNGRRAAHRLGYPLPR